MPRPVEQQGNLKEGWAKLKRLQSRSLDQKVAYANRLIARALKRHRSPVLCWSGGKDSTVLLHLVLQQAPAIPVVFNDTGVEFPETREFVETIQRDWHINLHVARPDRGRGFWDVAETMGWPLLGKEQSDNIERARRRLEAAAAELEAKAVQTRPPTVGRGKGKPAVGNGTHPGDSLIPVDQIVGLTGMDKLSDMELALVGAGVEISTRCCEFLKEKPTKAVETALGADCKILGLMASESRRRALVWIDHGDYYFHKDYFARTRGIWKVSPISIWREADIWEYHRRFDLPHCTIYDLGHDRNGCWTCGMGVKFGQLGRLRKSHPKLFHYLMVKRGMGRELLKAKLAVGANVDMDRLEAWSETTDIGQLLEHKPCFFDTL